MKFRKKPVVVEAVNWNGTPQSMEEVWELAKHAQTAVDIVGLHVFIATLEGQMTAELGDWLIKGVKGEIYPCKPDIFVMTYEVAE